MKDLSSIRQEYTQRELSEEEVFRNPFEQFSSWFNETQTARITEPTAMVLGTAGKTGRITQRTVLLKAFDRDGFVFYTNYESRKAKQLGENPQASLLFPWYQLERQVSVIGSVERVSTAQSAKYFLSRPLGSQMGAWISDQSKVITSRSILETKLAEIKRKFKDGKVPLPDFWGGYRLIPTSIEFWQGRKNRLHDRIMYTKEQNDWRIDRLSPWLIPIFKDTLGHIQYSLTIRSVKIWKWLLWYRATTNLPLKKRWYH